MSLKIYNSVVFVHGLPHAHAASNGSTQKTVYAVCHSWLEFACLTGARNVAEVRDYGSQCSSQAVEDFCMAQPGKAFYEVGHTRSGCSWELLPLPDLPDWAVRNATELRAKQVAAQAKRKASRA